MDILYLDVTDISLHTVLDDQEPVSKYEIQFRDMLAKFKVSLGNIFRNLSTLIGALNKVFLIFKI